MVQFGGNLTHVWPQSVALLGVDAVKVGFEEVVLPGWSKVLEHTLVVIGEHSLQGARHRVSPEEVMVESIVSI